jgi:hypothetical protein
MDRCVPMDFMGMPHGNYCLRLASATCNQPYTVTTPMRTSVSGAAAASYCGILESSTTCEAVEDTRASRVCAGPDDCGAPSLNDGLCESIGGMGTHCTYPCGVAAQCPLGLLCGGAYCGS